MNYYVYFGQNGWPAKFDAIFSYLNDNHCGLRVYGMTTAPLLRDFLFEKSKHKSFYGQLDDSTDLVQKFVGKTADLLDVEKLEEKYGISLWKIIYAERRFITHLHSRRYTTHKFTHQELLNICVGMLHFFENALDNIDYVIMPNPASSWAMGLAIVAENRGIEIRAIRSLSHPNNRAIWGDGPYEKWISVDQEFDKMRLDSNRHRLDLTKEARFLEDFVSHGETPLWLQQTDTQGKISRVVNVSRLTRVIKRIAKGQEGVRSSYAYSPLTFATQLFKFKVNRMLIKGFKNKLFDQPKKGEDFIFYAMHLEPEAALSVNGQHCLNQISLIE